MMDPLDPDNDPSNTFPHETITDLYSRILPEKIQDVTKLFVKEQMDVLACPTDKNVVVSAGAGSGKTTTLIAVLLKRGIERKGDFTKMCVLCYSVNAVKELQSRFKKILGPAVLQDLEIRTFHSLCLEGLNRFRNQKHRLKPVSPMINSQVEEIIGNILENPKFLSIPRETADALRVYQMTNFEMSFGTEQECEKVKKEFVEEVKRRIDLYAGDPMDYYNIVVEYLKVVENNDLDILGNKDFIGIDELQDVDVSLKKLVKRVIRRKRFFGVGDPNQNIFMFSGRYVDMIKELSDEPNTTKFRLEENHRSKPGIVSVTKSFLSDGSLDLPELEEKNVFFISVEAFEFQPRDIKGIIDANPDVRSWGILGTKHNDLEFVSNELHSLKVQHVRWKGDHRPESNIVVATIYGAKGSEFGGVIIINVVRYSHPNFHYTMNATDVINTVNVQRAKNIFHVGITRPEKVLYLLGPNDMTKCPSFRGRIVSGSPGESPYVAKLGKNCERKFSKNMQEHPKILKSRDYQSFKMVFSKEPRENYGNYGEKMRKRKRENDEDTIVEDIQGPHKKRKLD